MSTPVLTFLSLLAREAPTVESERPLVEARAARASYESIDEIEHARAVALRVRALLDRRRRREAELTALFDTASDVAVLHDLDSVLEALVRPARVLLDVDLTYMTLNDEAAGDTYMRVTDGSVSAQFQHLRGTALRATLAAYFAASASPAWTAEILSVHVNTVSQRLERLTGLLGEGWQRPSRAIEPQLALRLRHLRAR